MMIILALAGHESPLIKYFSFIILGLVLSVGYLVWRILSTKNKRDENAPRGVEDFLREAEQAAKNRKAGVARPEVGDVLALSEEDLQKRADLRGMTPSAASHATPQSGEQQFEGEKEP